jgi:hypothetical protein
VISRDEYDHMIAESLSEKTFQAQVRKTLESLGWQCFVIPDMRKTLKGWPDLFAIHPDYPRALSWELKSQGGRVLPHQAAVRAIMAALPGVDARILRPSEWPEVRDRLIEEMQTWQRTNSALRK